MIFFNRKLYDGLQPGSGWERRAERACTQLAKTYSQYHEAIAPLVPKSVVGIMKHALHDAEVISAKQSGKRLVIELDATESDGKYRGQKVQVIFSGVQGKVPVRGLVGQWWLYEELHLSTSAAFRLHVMFTDTDWEIHADDVSVSKLK